MNRRSLMGHAALVFAVIGIPAAYKSEAQESNRRDGTWWRGLSVSDRLLFVVGFMDGMDLGGDFSYWGMSSASSKACAGAASESYGEMVNKYFANTTSGQLADGLTDFYEDYRNRSILIHGAAWLVVQGIAGVPKDELEKSIESWRKNAAASP